MNSIARTAVGLTAATALAVPTALMASGPAAADGAEREVRGNIGTGSYEFGAERDDRRLEVSLDVDFVEPGSRWRVVVEQNGNRILKTTKRADREGDWDVDRNRPDTAGTDTFTMTIKRIGGTAKASDRVTVG